MIKNKTGESLIGVIIGVFILSFIILGISDLMINSMTVVNGYENKRNINIIKKNTIKIISKIDTSKIKETEIFYLYKDNTNKEFKIFTGSINSQYKYIDKNGNKIDNLEDYKGDIYSRVLWGVRDDTSLGEQHQIIKASIKKLIKK